MSDFKLDGRRWKFLDSPKTYIKDSDLKLEPLERQFKTAKEILRRFQRGRGVLLADDVGLGKTTVGALVAWIVATQDKRVRIYAPNEVLRRRWAEELERHAPMHRPISGRIKQGDVGRLNAGMIQVATHHTLVKSYDSREQRTACDLMIIDEAHRAKGDGSEFNSALSKLEAHAKRKLILTATPFSISLAELERLLQFTGATDLDEVRRYADELKRLYALGDGHDVALESKRLVGAAKAAIDQLRPFLIRHGIDDLSATERKHFGDVDSVPWDITTPPASADDIKLLLRMDRLLQLGPKRKGQRRNDPRFHIGWWRAGTEIERADKRWTDDCDHAVARHIKEARTALTARLTTPHPKIAAVSEAIRPLLTIGEKVLVFCHHRVTAAELLTELERALKADVSVHSGPPEKVWRTAWESVFKEDREEPLLKPIIDWLCSSGLRAQVGGWVGKPANDSDALEKQLETSQPRHAGQGVPTIKEAALHLKDVLLDTQSTSTRALLKGIARGKPTFGGQISHFPGRLDEGLLVMGSWKHDGDPAPPKTLYTGKADIVLALFNSPFGPDVLVTTDRLSEGVDLHRCCRHLIQYELDPSPVRTLQRNGRVRRVGSWAALTGKPIQYSYPTFGGTRDEKAVEVMRHRINAFGLLLGGVPPLDNEMCDCTQNFADAVLRLAREELKSLNGKLTVQC